MKKSLTWALLCGVGILFASCGLNMNNADQFSKSDLYGTWQADGTKEYVRFLSADQDTIDGDYLYGYEWDEGDETKESDMWHPASYHGNGWFKWILQQAELTEIILMSNKGAEYKEIYSVNVLNSTELKYTDKYKKQHSFTKVVSPKDEPADSNPDDDEDDDEGEEGEGGEEGEKGDDGGESGETNE